MTDITYDDIFAALLSMDVYNRTTNQGVFVSSTDAVADSPDTTVGNAKILKVAEDENQSFHAIAYQVGGKIYIDYRGTDDFDGPNMDPKTGWLVGAGVSQALRAPVGPRLSKNCQVTWDRFC
jgi:hypothetical protein